MSIRQRLCRSVSNCINFSKVYRHLIVIRTLSTSSSNVNFQPDDITKYDRNIPFDLIVVGGGIVGVTTARALLIEKPNLKIAVLEKEPTIAIHQTGHNSGVIHAGIYYRTGSLKAKFCVAGLHATYKFCDTHRVPYKKCGKVIVATNRDELPLLRKLFEQGIANNSPDLDLIGPNKLRKIEPHCQGVSAIHSPHTGIIDWALFTKYCAKDFQKRGGLVFCDYSVSKIEEASEGVIDEKVTSRPLVFHSKRKGFTLRSSYGITCGGLYSDKIAHMADGLQEPMIIPFRGEYLELKKEKCSLVNGNIYPVPDPRFPFLGVHFTPRLDGNVWLGPNAVLALSREGYSWKHVNFRELFEMGTFKGFYKLMSKYGLFGAKEMWKSFFISKRVEDLQKYIPELQTHDVVFRGATGVRAQAIDENGNLMDDLILQLGTAGIEQRIIHIRNAPSPAATSSLALAEFIAKSANVEFEY